MGEPDSVKQLLRTAECFQKIPFGLVILGIASAVVWGQDDRLDPPGDSAQKSALKVVRDIFKDEYARRTPAGMQALAKKLVRQAQETKDDPVSRFVLLSEAQDLSVQSGDLETAVQAIREMSLGYRVSESALKASALSGLSKIANDPADQRTLTKAYLALAGDLILADDFETALKCAQAAAALARRAKDVPLLSLTDSKEKEIASRKALFDATRKAKETLSTNPDDATANGLVGRYLCLIKGDWAAGLPLLAKGQEGPLRSAALKELSNPVDAQAKGSLGDDWWAISEKESNEAKGQLRGRAAFWYRQAVNELTGLSKAKVEKRLTELTLEKQSKGNWIDFSEPGNFGVKGKSGDPIELVEGRPGSRVTSQAFPQGTFDAVSVRMRFKPNLPSTGSLTFGRLSAYDLCNLDTEKKLFFGPSLVPGGKTQQTQSPLPVRDAYILTVFLLGGEWIIYLDGEEVRRWKGPPERLETLALWAIKGIVIFDQIKLRRKE